MATHPIGEEFFIDSPNVLAGLRHVFVKFDGDEHFSAVSAESGARGGSHIGAITLRRMRTRRAAVNSILSAVVVLLLVAAFILLGRWQWHRTYRSVDGYSAEPAAVPLRALVPEDAAIPATAVARQVIVFGKYAVGGQHIVQGHSLSGQAVSWVVTPLVTPDNREIFVVRGWTITGSTALASPTTTAVSVTGRIEIGNVLNSGTMPNFYLIRTAQSPPDPLSLQPVPAAPPDDHAPQEFHLQNAIYVVQWYLLAVVAVVTWWRLRRTSRQPDPAGIQQPLEATV